jgi:hypothetical protein
MQSLCDDHFSTGTVLQTIVRKPCRLCYLEQIEQLAKAEWEARQHRKDVANTDDVTEEQYEIAWDQWFNAYAALHRAIEYGG